MRRLHAQAHQLLLERGGQAAGTQPRAQREILCRQFHGVWQSAVCSLQSATLAFSGPRSGVSDEKVKVRVYTQQLNLVCVWRDDAPRGAKLMGHGRIRDVRSLPVCGIPKPLGKCLKETLDQGF